MLPRRRAPVWERRGLGRPRPPPPNSPHLRLSRAGAVSWPVPPTYRLSSGRTEQDSQAGLPRHSGSCWGPWGGGWPEWWQLSSLWGGGKETQRMAVGVAKLPEEQVGDALSVGGL